MDLKRSHILAADLLCVRSDAGHGTTLHTLQVQREAHSKRRYLMLRNNLPQHRHVLPHCTMPIAATADIQSCDLLRAVMTMEHRRTFCIGEWGTRLCCQGQTPAHHRYGRIFKA